MAFDVVVFGSLHLDIMVLAPDRPRRGETLAGQSWRLSPGGKGGNQAVQAASAGARTAMIGVVGDDDFGRVLVQNLADHGVDTSQVTVRADAGSGISVAITDAGGDYGAVIVSGANLLLDAGTVTAAAPLFEGAGWLLLQNEVTDAGNLAALAAARLRGVKTILNAAPSRALPAAMNGLVDILVVNELEAEAMGAAAVTSLATASVAAKRLLEIAGAVIVTAGAAGAAVASRNGRAVEIAGHAVDLVSTHGAGDCFIGVLAARLAAGAGLDDAARYANSAAALHVSAPAGSGGRHDGARIRDLLRGTG